MASVTVTRPDLFPAGTSVSAYVALGRGTDVPTSGPPSGTAVGSFTVAPDGSLALTGLADSTSYVLYASAPDRYLRISTPPASQSSSAVLYTPRGWNANFLARLGQAGSQLARVGFIGDSILWGAYTSNPDTKSIPALIAAQLQASYGDGGSGMKTMMDTAVMQAALSIAASATTAWGTAGALWTVTGSGWSQYTGNDQYGPGYATLKTITVGDTYSASFRGTSVKIFTIPNAGGNAAWRYRIDGGTWVDVTDAGAFGVRTTTASGLSAGAHTIEVQCNGDGVKTFFLCAIQAENAAGVVVHKMARYGMTTAQAAELGSTIKGDQWNGGRSNPVDLAVVELGANDANAGTSADTYIAELSKLLNELRGGGTATGTTDVMLVMPHVGKYDNATPKWGEYTQRARGLAAAYGCAFVNLWADGRNSWNAWSNASYWGTNNPPGGAGADNIHLSDAGAAHAASVIAPVLTAAVA